GWYCFGDGVGEYVVTGLMLDPTAPVASTAIRGGPASGPHQSPEPGAQSWKSGLRVNLKVGIARSP
ncbi:MAG: hypothetical protein ACN0LA_14885, partial [Candidatus Longimicrobiales bacterium M2_2A_002]